MNTFTELTSLESGFADFLTLLKKMLLKIKFQQSQRISMEGNSNFKYMLTFQSLENIHNNKTDNK